VKKIYIPYLNPLNKLEPVLEILHDVLDAEDEIVKGAMMNQNFVPIVDDRGMLCGILTRKRYMEYLAEKAGS